MEIINSEEVSINSRRKFILDLLPGIFEELDPKNAASAGMQKYSGKVDRAGRIHVLGFGKAAYRMYGGIRDYVLDKVSTATIIVPDDEKVESQFHELEIMRGTHPFTSQLSVESSESALKKMNGLDEDDLVVVLISGGSSALFEIPEDGVSIENISDISRCLMNSDADIYDLNRIRSSISKVKGGKLARMLYPSKVISLIISDVAGDDPGIIASGPLVRNFVSVHELNTVLDRYDRGCKTLLDRVREFGKLEEIPIKFYKNVENHIILKNLDFVNAIYERILHSGKNVLTLGSGISGDVQYVAEELSSILRGFYRLRREGFWFVLGGETTVTVTGKGIGGRNEELSMRFAKCMKKGEEFLFLSIGTDGIDGLSPAMGGIIDNDSLRSMDREEMEASLKDNDSYNFLRKHNGAILTGRTGNNVSDIMIGYYSGKDEKSEA